MISKKEAAEYIELVGDSSDKLSAYINQEEPIITSNEIIKELNYAYDVKYKLGDSSYQYVENDGYCSFFYDMNFPEFKYWKLDREIMFSDEININIAQKITKFFMQKER